MAVATAQAETTVATDLTSESLLALCAREIGAIHVEGFYPADIAVQVAAEAVDHPALGNYHKKHTSSVGRVYMPHIDTKWDPELTERYHDAAVPSIHEIRSLVFPYMTPADYMRLLLQELWPAGANLLHLRGRACFAGAFRIFQPKTSEFFPHNDWIGQETDAPEVDGVTEQLVANMYLQVPGHGGDLQLWLREPTEDEADEIVKVEGLHPDTIEPPRLTFHPNDGDLILFSSRMLHAVTPVMDDAHRVAMAVFVACKGPDEPLAYWS